MRSRICFHLPRHLFETFDPNGHTFQSVAKRAFEARGAVCEVRMRVAQAPVAHYERENFHFIHQGRVRAPHILNTGLAYVSPFWYADPDGVMSFSSLADKPFDPASLSTPRVQQFFERMVGQIREHGQSKYEQPKVRDELGAGAIAVFLQGPSEPVSAAQYMSEREMMQAVIAHKGGRDVIVKHHPRNPEPKMVKWLASQAARDPSIRVVDAHVHDMLDACAFSVSICSGASFESLLMQKPTVVFGQVDFHHCAETVRHVAQVSDAFTQVMARNFPFKEYILWHWGRHCINIRRGVFAEKLIQRMGARGFDVERLGLE
jgi:hypothetical protein